MDPSVHDNQGANDRFLRIKSELTVSFASDIYRALSGEAI